MANFFKNAIAENVSNNSSSPTSVLTCPSGNSSKCVIIGFQLTNTGSSEITATVSITDNSASNDIVLVNAVVIPNNTMLAVFQSDKIILEESDIIKVHSNTASACNAFISYLLTDST